MTERVALTLVENLGAFAGIALAAFVIYLLFRPFRLDVTVRHKRENGDDEDEESSK